MIRSHLLLAVVFCTVFTSSTQPIHESLDSGYRGHVSCGSQPGHPSDVHQAGPLDDSEEKDHKAPVLKRAEEDMYRAMGLLNRRSALDKNFMRFGRNGNSNFMRFGRNGNSNFMRFGRNGNGNFMRFGRGQEDGEEGGDRHARREENNFMRFGRDPNSNFMRFGRDPNSNFMRFGKSQSSNFMRFGRTRQDTNFMRLGRGSNDNFMRFGRTSYDDTPFGDSRTAQEQPAATNGDGEVKIRSKRSTEDAIYQDDKAYPSTYGSTDEYYETPTITSDEIDSEPLVLPIQSSLPAVHPSYVVIDSSTLPAFKKHSKKSRGVNDNNNYIRFG